MVNCCKHAIDSIESVQRIAGESSTTPVQLNERQCQLVAQELEEIRVFLEKNNVIWKSDHSMNHIILHQLASAIKRAKLLVKRCCCKDSASWLLAAIMLVEIQEEFANIILDIHLWRMLLDIAIASARGLSHEQKAEHLMKMDEKYHGLFNKLRRENHALQQAALKDKRAILLRIAEVRGSPNDLEYLRAIYLQSFLTHSPVGTGHAASMVMKLNKFKIVHLLGSGGCGTVFEVTWLGFRCALKILNVQDAREATALKGLFHPNIIRLFHYWEAGSPPRIPTSYLLMELMPTDLATYIEGRLKSMPASSTLQTGKDTIPFSLPVAVDIMEQVAQAMLYMHDRHLSHRDLKPSNILVKERENVGLTSTDGGGYLDIKLADFGLAKPYDNASTTRAHTVNTGTPIYGAPEIFGKDLASLERHILPMADVWSFGITCAEILSGKKPYAGEPTLPRLEFQRRISREGLRPILPKHCPPYLAFCISSCWELLPERRPSFASICLFLRHAKLLSLGVTDLDDSKKCFAYTTRSGYVKSLCEPKTSLGERFSTFFQLPFHYMRLGVQLVPTIVEGKTGSVVPGSTSTTNAGASVDLKLVNQDGDADLDQSSDRITLELDNMSVNSLPLNAIPVHLSAEGVFDPTIESITLPYEAESMVSDSPSIPLCVAASDLGLPSEGRALVQADSGVDKGRDLPIVIPDDASVRSLPLNVIPEHLGAEDEINIGSMIEPTTSPLEAGFMISNANFIVNQASTTSDLGRLQEDCDAEQGGDPHMVILDDANSRSLGSAPSQPPSTKCQGPFSSWIRGEYLGSGPSGAVYEGVSSTGSFFAVKEVSLSNQERLGKQTIKRLEQEIAVLSKIQHPNIVQYLGTQRDDKKLYIFTELVKMGSLVYVYKTYGLFYEQIREYTQQILCGLKYLHGRKIGHRDIKCAHILVHTSGVVKLSDFGMTQQLDASGVLRDSVGSPNWMAPEVIHSGQTDYNLMADIWSLGCTVLEMATRKPPFADVEEYLVLWKVARGEAPPIPDDLPEDLKDFLYNCLQVNVAERPTCELLLTHPFITGAPMSGPVKLVADTEPSSKTEEWPHDTSTSIETNEASMSSLENTLSTLFRPSP